MSVVVCRLLFVLYWVKLLLVDCCGVILKYVCMYLLELKCRFGLIVILLLF